MTLLVLSLREELASAILSFSLFVGKCKFCSTERVPVRLASEPGILDYFTLSKCKRCLIESFEGLVFGQSALIKGQTFRFFLNQRSDFFFFSFSRNARKISLSHSSFVRGDTQNKTVFLSLALALAGCFFIFGTRILRLSFRLPDSNTQHEFKKTFAALCWRRSQFQTAPGKKKLLLESPIALLHFTSSFHPHGPLLLLFKKQNQNTSKSID